jgi:hypothetical protein
VRRNEILEGVLALLRSHGFDPTVEYGKHIKVRWVVNGKTRMQVVSFSSSDNLAAKNALSDVRKSLRMDGVLRSYQEAS